MGSKPTQFPLTRKELITFWASVAVAMSIFGVGIWVLTHFIRKFW